MLSLNPRSDLFRFVLPKDFIPKDIEEKYFKILGQNNAVVVTPIDYLNESIQGINIPGITDILIAQSQHSSNTINKSDGPRGRLNVEPKTDITYHTSANPLDKINKEFTVTFRMNQGLYNYFLLYETIFYHICKPIRKPCIDVLYLDILGETGEILSRLKFMDCFIDGIDGLDFSYNKTTRDSNTFNMNMKFNNIDFDFVQKNPSN